MFLFLTAAMPSHAGHVWEVPIEWNGDVNRDGDVNMGDVTDLVDALLVNDTTSMNYDVNVDSVVNIADVVDLIDMLLTEPDDLLPIPLDTITFNMVYVRSDTYMMGATDEQSPYAADDEYPPHKVKQYPFYIGETEVTQGLWRTVMGSIPCESKVLKQPVENVSWEECQEFIRRLNLMTGRRFRLPTEAEWELAARGGRSRHGYIYAGSNTLADVGWFDSNSAGRPHNVRSLQPNELKIYDMSGNVWEWCQDWYGAYGSDYVLNPTGPETGASRVLRGGSWMNIASLCRVSTRRGQPQDSQSPTMGFRLALDAPYTSWFMLSSKVVRLYVGEQKSVDILNGNGSYTIYNNSEIVGCRVNNEKLILTGIKVGTTDVVVKDNISGDKALVTVIVSNHIPHYPDSVVNVRFNMIYVEGGSCKTGATDEQGSDAYSQESPAHWNTLSDYLIGETEVTQALWTIVMGSNPSSFTGDLQRPVERVSWEDCMEFLDRLNDITGKDYRLPTETEWEYAARGGIFSQGFKYAGSNSIDDVAWYTTNSSNKTHAVATKLPNELGAYDMSGNVFEWCQDWYGNYTNGIAINPTGPETGSVRVSRGGAFSSSDRMCRVSYRRGNNPTTLNNSMGMRLALDAPGTHRFDLSRHIVRMEVGEHRSLNILNGSGDYTLYNPSTAIVNGQIEGETLLLTGLSVGKTTLIVKDNTTQDRAFVTVIVTKRKEPVIIPVLNDTIWMEYVKGGTFNMGGTDEQGSSATDNELPTHQVTLSSYYICNSEVTQHLWYAVMGSNPSHFNPADGFGGDLYRPVENVSWEDCQWFVARLNMLTGRNFRLPSEAEWEFAARGGTRSEGYVYAGGNNVGDVAWYSGNSDNITHHGRLKACNELDLYDMSGNVGEWCQDRFDPYIIVPQYNPYGQFTGEQRVWRGGAWNGDKNTCRVSYRGFGESYDKKEFIGLRLAMDAEEDSPSGGGDLNKRFRLSSTVVTLEVGEQVNLSILNGHGNYTVLNKEQYVLADVEGETLTLTGKAVGVEDVIVRDNITQAYALVTAIVVEPTPPQNVVLDDSVTFEMIYIPAGAFVMGDDAVPGASPAHYVSVNDYYIGSTEVTNLMWRWVMGYPINWKATDLYKPVEGMSWDDCQDFIERLNEKTGRKYRLPTEAEWEYAAMGANASKGYRYSGSNVVGDVAWYWDNLPSQQLGTTGYGVQRVSGKRANEKGIYDMSGNVREWCQDWYGVYPMGIQNNPTGPESGSDRVLRGGCYLDSSDPCRVKARSASRQSGSNYVGTGFRLAMDVVHDTTTHHTMMSLSETIIRIPVGGQRYVDIFNGSGSYTLYNNNPAITTCLIDGERLLLNGIKVGTTDVKVVDNITLATAWLTVIVYQPGSGIDPIPGPDELFNEPDMIFVHGGTFVRGATSEQGASTSADELPIHQVTVSNYYISKTEVTQRLWQRVMGGNPSHFKGDSLPVDQVSWEDCQEFIRRLNQMTGRQYRLLTEAEWEYAARGARLSMGYKYAGSNTMSNVGWYKGNSSNTSHGVAQKSPNELGVYDMSGNVWEWCQDCYGEYSAGNQFNPVGPDPELSGGTSAIQRVMRGGAWDGNLSDCRVARRMSGAQDLCATNVGLRLAMDAYAGAPLTVSPRVLELNVGEQATVSILNGTGDYSATGGGSIASFQLSGSSLTVTGLEVGTTTINIKDNTTLARTVLTVIVTQPHEPYTYKTITFWIRYISGGAFDQGATSEQGSDAAADESPVHRSMVPSFGIGETEVTQELWTAVMGYNPSVNTGDPQMPVDNVTWEEAEQFVARLSDLCDRPFRLPTEAEWEYAARGGLYGSPYKYAGSNTIGNVAWYSGNSGGTTHTVGSKAHNSEWLYDMSGNVDEWCHDWYGPYSADPVFDPMGPDTADYHVARGGRWDSPAASCRVSARSADGFGSTLPGVRIAMERPYSYWFWLSRNIVWLKVGGHCTVDIHNGSGSYTIYSSKSGIASYVVDGDQISLTGLKEGRTVLQVMDNVTHEHKTLTVIVRNPVVPTPPDDGDEDDDPTPGLEDLLKMVYVSGGTFAMGATSEQGNDAADDENPSHLVTLSSFYVGKTEVTQALWKRVMGGNPSHFKNDYMPVEQVTWEECQEFISRLNNMTGRQYRLLTEAEWEFAARGGNKSKKYKYAGSNTVGDVAWYSGNSSNMTHIVSQKTKNELGIFDMSGNVGEWCQDAYGAYSAENQKNPVGVTPNGAVVNRVVRGGAWDSDAAGCRVSSRAYQSQDYSDSHIGLRLARDGYDSGSDGLVIVDHRLVEMEVGEQTTVGITGGSGNYVAAGGGDIVNYSLSGSTLTLTALQEGTTTVNIKDNTSTAWTIVTVIVNEPEIPYKYRNISFWIRYISGGTFDQGGTEEQGSSAQADESPVHRTMLPAYGIGKYEVTQELWQAVMGYNNSVNRGSLQLPVDNITWEEAQEFVSRLSDIFDKPFRLPTEAEWEFAARGARSSKGYKYAGGNQASTVAWYSGNAGGTTHAVGTKKANERTLYDMSGNVDEWCHDWYGPYSGDVVFDPMGPLTGEQHVVRGGRWDSPAASCRVSARSAGGFGTTLPGLRVALEYPYSYYFSLSRQTVWMEVGNNRSVTIYNGSGSYTITCTVDGVVSYVVNGDKLLLTGLHAGNTVITVHDNVAQEEKTISVTVEEPAGTNEPEDVDGAEFEMIYVSGGTFMMGGTDEQGTDAYTREKPVHRVTLHDFKISNIEVTQELWQNVMGSNPSTFTGDLQLPVDNVSWEDCQLFIAKLNEKTGKHYRLPTEAEWEYAARGGACSLGYKYAGSNTIGNVAWYSSNSSSKTHVVGSKNAPNELGIHDMSGNVSEWCQDWYGNYTEDPQTNPTGPTSGTTRCARGGSWSSAARACRVSHRLYYAPTAATNQYGLRLVEDVYNPLRFGLSSTMLSMEPGDQETVNILNGSGDYTLDAGSSVVTCVLSGETITVTANAVGATTVSVTDNATGENVILTVIVTEPVAPFGLSQSELTIEVGETATVSILNGRGNYTVRASTSGIVTPTISGETLSVRALKAGTTTLTVTDVLTQSTATLTVTVTAPTLPLALSQDNVTMVVGTSTTVNILNGKGSYSVAGGTGIVSTVISGNTLSLQALAEGTATVTVTDLITGYSASLTVTVIQAQRGDVNCDGVIDENDYGELYQIVNQNKTPISTYTADVNADGSITFDFDLNCDNSALVEILYNDLMKSWNGYPFNDMSMYSAKYDINGDGMVSISDFTAIVYGVYNGTLSVSDADLDGDGTVNWRDVCIFHAAWLKYCGYWPYDSTEDEYTVNGVTFKMITVEGGTFTMGATSEFEGEALSNEVPTHQVTLSSYKIGQTEVTQELWQAVMGSNPSNQTGNLQLPVENVTWNDCQNFVLSLNQLTGKQFRLPYEAEWEFAARGGNYTHSYKYAGSNTIGNVAWYSGNSNNLRHPVMTKSPNELGLYDMSGNVYEWCMDWLGNYSSTAQTDPTGPVTATQGLYRIIRGGDWKSEAVYCHIPARMGVLQDFGSEGNGVRLALDLDDSPKFRLAETVVTVEVGESKTINILNGNGSYSVAGSTANFTRSIVLGKLKVTGTTAGVNTVTVTNSSTGAKAVLTVIVTEPYKEESFTVNGVTFKMVSVPGGTFTMGDDASSYSNQKPGHQVTLSDYMIGQTEVTQELWQAVMGSNPSYFTGKAKRPVEQVTWSDCQAFVMKLNQLTGRQFRLPTEAEWEFAALGGNSSHGYTYSGSNTIGDVAWYSVNAGSGVGSSSADYSTHEVGTKAPNELRLYDMTGNVREWCLDWFGNYSSAAQSDPTGATTGSYRLTRGGYWSTTATYCAVKYRVSGGLTLTSNTLGLRLALDEDDSPKFRLAESVVKVEVSESKTIDILNGNGSYSVAGSTAYFTRSIVNGKLSITGTSVGTNTVTVTNTATGATAVLTVIVTEPATEEEITVNGVTFKMIRVDGGTYDMYNGGNSRQTTISTFSIGQTEVTQELWKAVMGSSPSSYSDNQQPVSYISWFDCQEFIYKLNQLSGKNFRLPTGAEWEFAAKGGNLTHGYTYAGSDTIDVVAWYKNNSSGRTHPVATKQPNELGIYDMSGNVEEWCQDYDGSYGSAPLYDPIKPFSGWEDHLFKGGDYAATANYCTPNIGWTTDAVNKQYDVGLRLAMDLNNTSKFRLSESVVTLEIGESKSLTILNGSGSYSIVHGDCDLASVQISGTSFTLTGVASGTSTIMVTDNSTGRQSFVNVIVTDTNFRLSTNQLTIEVGEQRPVAIYNGSGSYTVTGGGTVVNKQISGDHVIVTGAKAGTTTLTVTDAATGSTATLRVTVKASTGNKEFFTVNGSVFTMVKVAGGTFTMGDNNSIYSSEKPAHQVTLTSYSIGQTEVTQELWQAVMGSNPSEFIGNPYRPVDKISWNESQEFILKLNQLTGRKFRLPTEAEWEFAALGGNSSHGYTYSGSNTIGEVGWYKYNSSIMGSSSSSYGTHEVATKLPNELELYDMTGNVGEFCQDYWNAYTSDAQSNPAGPVTGTNRSFRGGYWSTGAFDVKYRSSIGQYGKSNIFGFRLALDDVYASRFRLSETVITVELGQSKSVSILNGNGSYTVGGGTEYATSTLSGNTLTIKGNHVGTTTVIVTNTSTGAQAAVTAIITPTTRFRLSTDAISIDVGEQRAVQIFNGGGNYTVTGGGTVVSKQISGDHLLVTGSKAGSTTLTVTDSSTGSTATLSVTVVNDANRQSFTVGGVTFTMVTVAGGTFTLGVDVGATNQRPAHQVTLSKYSIGQTEVTQALWQAVMGSNPSAFTGNPYRPVEKVSWNDCQEFIYKLNQMSGKQFRMPTEAEWEFAARGGNSSQGYTYSGSNVVGEVAWYDDNAYDVGADSPDYGAHEVATKMPNELGLYDMSGNVTEFCSDWYVSSGYPSGAQTNPAGQTSGTYRINRGGCWRYGYGLDNKYRNTAYGQTTHNDYNGLRLVLDVTGSGKFQLSETVVKLTVGSSKTVNIQNGNGSYTVAGGTDNFTSTVSGSRLTVKGTAIGTNSVIVTNTSTGAQAVLTVIVAEAVDEVTPKPTITYEVEDNDVVIAAIGEGHILLYCDDNLRAEGEGAAWLTIPRDEEDRDYTITATAQAEGLQISETAIMEIIVPALETPPPPGEDFTVNGVTFTMMPVAGGTFTMGDNNGTSWEKPAHQVTLSAFKIGMTEVTQALWQAVMGSNPSYFTGNLQRPVENITWIQAHEFVSRLNQLTGKKFRLPTDAEWEFAARGGTSSKGYTYAGSNTIGNVAWYSGNSSSTTHPVATKSANELGLYDMSGNVAEWTQDLYYDYTSAAQTNPNLGDYDIVCRNGGYSSNATNCKVTSRWEYDGMVEYNAYNSIGFRIALDDESTTKFRLSETVFHLEAGKQATVNILNGNGSYTVSNIYICSDYEGLVTSQISGNRLIVTGQNPGIDRLKVTNTSTGATAVLTVIVTKATQEHEYVDLGLPSGTLWATCNVGASAPEEYGDYFAWGETEPKDIYDLSTYKWCNGTYNSMTKYCTSSIYGTVDNKTELEVADDAATANWGASWRMPTYDQQTELIEKCSWTWTTQNGVNGYLVTGSNGNTLFLPAAGDRYGSSLRDAGSWGDYWSRTLDSSSPNCAYNVLFYSRAVGWSDYGRDDGLTVRAVRVPQN